MPFKKPTQRLLATSCLLLTALLVFNRKQFSAAKQQISEALLKESAIQWIEKAMPDVADTIWQCAAWVVSAQVFLVSNIAHAGSFPALDHFQLLNIL